MTPDVAFRLYLATRLHFLTKYDVFKSNGKFKGQDKVIDRKDLYLVNQISKNKSEREFIELCAANFIYGNDKFLYEPTYAEDNYEHWLKVKQSIGHTLERDLGYIEIQLLMYNISFDKYLSDRVISDLLSRKIEYESVIILNRKIQVIDKISGFDSDKYKVRMHKGNNFVAKGILADKHSSHIDNFLSNVN